MLRYNLSKIFTVRERRQIDSWREKGGSMHPENILKAGSKLHGLFTDQASKARLNAAKASPSPTKIYYLWEKNGFKRVELFSMV